MMKHVAFFRYVNFGKPGSPTSTDLIEALGGSDIAINLQTNGTVIFTSDQPEAHITRAIANLRESGFTQEVMVRPLDEINRIVTEHSAHCADETIHRIMVSFFDLGSTERKVSAPLRSTNGLVETRHLADGYAVSACWARKTSVGDATVLLERTLGVPVTSRTIGTLERLIRKHNLK